MNDASLIEDCLFWIKTTDYVSMVELEKWLGDRGVQVEGQHALEAAHNVIIWGGISERFCEVFDELRPHLEVVPASSILVYLVDGKIPQLPIAKRPPRNGYKEPHWAPVTLRTKQRATPAETGRALKEDARKRSAP